MQLPITTRRALQRHAAGKKLKPTIHHELHNLGLITDTGELTDLGRRTLKETSWGKEGIHP